MSLHQELNLDGLPGPTHGFAGLSFGNLASTTNKAAASNPRAAVLQGLEKIKLVASLGVPQGVLPPHPRPNVALLRRLGFSGTDAKVVEKTWKAEPNLLLAASSSSAMWTANAATICPSVDATDGKLHLTAANLAHQFHRSQEGGYTARILQHVFPRATHHAPLPLHPTLGDEGAANHIRLGLAGPGFQLFVHGDGADGSAGPVRYPARQTLRASRAISRLNCVREEGLFFLQQSPAAIDAGAFHNDVVSVGSGDVLLLHAQAFALPIDELRKRLPSDVHLLVVSPDELTLEEAVQTYLFNSQLVPTPPTPEHPEGTLALISPMEVAHHTRARAAAERLVAADTRLAAVHYIDLKQSMRNGGGPACLRLRVPVTVDELAAVHPGIRFTESLYTQLRAWAKRYYRDTLHPADLCDPQLLRESHDALDRLHQILALPTYSPDPDALNDQVR